MNPKIVIRTERAADEGAIGEVTAAAFAALQVSHHAEQFIVMALRAANALAVSLVAEIDGRVIGHIAFSPLTISDGTRNWYGLGPVRPVFRWARSARGRRFPRRMQGGWRKSGAGDALKRGRPMPLERPPRSRRIAEMGR